MEKRILPPPRLELRPHGQSEARRYTSLIISDPNYIGDKKFPASKVPRQCPFVLTAETHVREVKEVKG
jgi:hypothetical protein